MFEYLLPIGSVVLVHGGTKRLMITGRVQARVGSSRIYDYSGCRYPEGILAPNELFFFDHDDISRLFFVGFQDEEELAYRDDVLGGLGEVCIDEQGVIVSRA